MVRSGWATGRGMNRRWDEGEGDVDEEDEDGGRKGRAIERVGTYDERRESGTAVSKMWEGEGRLLSALRVAGSRGRARPQLAVAVVAAGRGLRPVHPAAMRSARSGVWRRAKPEPGWVANRAEPRRA